MKYYKLTDEEQKLLEEVENGKWTPVKNQVKARRDAIEAARNTLNKTKNINIRLSEKDLIKLKRKAAEEGLPYQTLVSSILHKFTSE
ncbi:MAG: hypothetical protein A2171_02245 [Candidatus Levybacteria bacterium RBG_13_35_9]|nr:MAG: hypothetical protein A2171_02245 [Candidatus Levybacteria bacterium RBG_13_35_9]